MFSTTEYYIYNSADGSRSFNITKSQVPLLNDLTNHQSNWCKPIYFKNKYIRYHENAYHMHMLKRM